MEACRICLSKEDGVNMLTEKLQDRQMFSVFLEFSGLNIPDFPTPMICLKCVEFLKTYLEMKVMVVDNSEYFMQFTVKKEFNDENSVEDSSTIAPDDDEILPLCDVIISKVEYIDENEEDDYESKLTKDNKSKVKREKTEKRVQWCHYCFQIFPRKTLLQQHLKEELTAHGGMVCDFCGFKNLSRTNFILHMKRIHIHRQFVCDRCTKSFPTNAERVRHVNREHLNARFICPICGLALKHKGGVDKHIKAVHEKQRPEVCTECGKAFATKGQLKVHTIQVHIRSKPYPCSICGKRFGSQPAKITHEQMHSNNARFPCEQCDYVTNRSINLYQHMKTHRDVYYFSCDTCGQQFKTNSAWNRHKLTHQENSFECEYCHKKFSAPQALKIHIESVHLHKRYPCPKCNQEFATMSNVKKHVKFKHDGIRFFCNCGKYFDERVKYTKHGEECHWAATNNPIMKSMHHGEIYQAPIGRPAKFKKSNENKLNE